MLNPLKELIMNKRIRQSAAIIALSSAALVAATLPVQAQNTANTQGTQQTTAQAAEQGQWLNLRQVYDKLEAAGYTDIREIDRERSGYEAKVRDGEGRKIKLYIDPRTGDVINRKTRDDRDDD